MRKHATLAIIALACIALLAGCAGAAKITAGQVEPASL